MFESNSNPNCKIWNVKDIFKMVGESFKLEKNELSKALEWITVSPWNSSSDPLAISSLKGLSNFVHIYHKLEM